MRRSIFITHPRAPIPCSGNELKRIKSQLKESSNTKIIRTTLKYYLSKTINIRWITTSMQSILLVEILFLTFTFSRWLHLSRMQLLFSFFWAAYQPQVALLNRKVAHKVLGTNATTKTCNESRYCETTKSRTRDLIPGIQKSLWKEAILSELRTEI